MSDARVAQLIEQALDYRGYVTVLRHDGSKLVGFVYDRSRAHVEMFDEAASGRIWLALDEISDVELTGDDVAAKAQLIWQRRHGTLESRHTSAWGEWETDRPTLFLVALPIELRGIAHLLDARIRDGVVRGRFGGHSAVALAVGMGGGAAQALASEQPSFVISCGFSGALTPSLVTGDLVLASSIRDEGGDSLTVAAPLLRAALQALGAREKPPAVGEILCATRVAGTGQEKRALARPGRLAVDLESWPAAVAAEQAGIPWLALRVVLDPLDADLPAFTREPHASYVSPALRYAFSGPRAVVELARLGLRARKASHVLGRALDRLGQELHALHSLHVPETRS